MSRLLNALCVLVWFTLAMLARGAAAADVPAAGTQGYPAKPVRLIVGFTPGGGVDINARLLAARLAELLGQQFIVENRPGAGTNIANDFVARSAPDGYTLLFTSPAVAINMSLYRSPPYDTLRDFAGVSVFSESTNVLVVPASLPVKSLQDLLVLARAQPGTLNYSSAGSGTTQHLAGELFKLRSATNIVHVPYKGSAPSIVALMSGDVQLSFVNPAAIGQHVKTGRLRALAIAGAKRSELMPEVPTMKEAGVDGVEVPLWYGLLAPAATPREIVQILAAAVAKAANSPETRQRLLDQGAEPVGSTPEQFGRQLREEVVRWAEVVKVSGARAD
ncbi:MAG: tripartite tricarboxylate transporter substrate binding protein [Burkholderiaceae bacterium]